ncbi:MAG: hypothetical protein KatS3mg013_0631 [Actinomycetota bacterium]|nr:MAG: hypothetical protein KatS3mg013_0631 [Actinomycetota bacterium]
MDARRRLSSILAERIAVLDGSWGVLLQGRGLSEEAFRGERFRDHDRELKGNPDVLNLTQPAIVREIHDAYLAAGADITTTNTFTATSIGQADYGLADAVEDINLAGARLAREAADAAGGRFVAGSVGPLNVTLSLSADVEDPSKRAITFDAVYEAYAQQIRALAAGAGRPAAHRDHLRHAERQGRDRGGQGRRTGPPPVAVGHDRRQERPNALGPDDRGLLVLRRARRAADRRRELLARRPRDALLGRGPRPRGPGPGRRLPERRPAERLRRVRRDPGDHELPARGVRSGRARERAGRLLRHRPRAHPDDRRGGPGGSSRVGSPSSSGSRP